MCGETNEKKLEKAHETEGTTTNWTLGEISHLSMHTRKGKAREDVCSRVSPYLLCSVGLQSLEKAGKMFQVSQALFNIFHVKVMVHKCFALIYFSVSEGYILLFS